MNRYARAFGLESTNFANAHGLGNSNNRSTAADIGKLSCISMQDPIMRDVCSKVRYECIGRDQYDQPKEFIWKSGNSLLSKGFNGVKPGWTPAAGPCVASSFEKDNLHLIIVVINTKTKDSRWVEVPKLALWAINRLQKLTSYFAENQLPNGQLKMPEDDH